MSGPTIFDLLKDRADLILARYPLLQGYAKPFDTQQKIAQLYYVQEKAYHPECQKKPYPENIPPWNLEEIKGIINAKMAAYTWIQVATVDDYMSVADVEALFEIFTEYVKEIKAFAHAQKEKKGHGKRPVGLRKIGGRT